MAVLLGYLIMFFSGILVAKKTKDRFGQLLAFGITFSIIISAFINVSVATGLVPTTGLPLPFISYGGTSLIFLCIAVGILINIALSNSVELKAGPQIIINKGRNYLTENKYEEE
jgi:cell division protein FtsW